MNPLLLPILVIYVACDDDADKDYGNAGISPEKYDRIRKRCDGQMHGDFAIPVSFPFYCGVSKSANWGRERVVADTNWYCQRDVLRIRRRRAAKGILRMNASIIQYK
uniref:Secreted protein n=1 Tax=Ascaris lumbricoides TaxID=6252 RepID=A0A0M3HQ64_ASCLU